MSGFSDAERMALLEPLQGLQVDPTKEASSMQQIDPGASGTVVVNADLTAYYEQYGKKATDRAFARGWRPKEEHKGNPDNWEDPIDFFDGYARRSDDRAEKAAEKRLAAIEKTVEKRMGELNNRIDRIDETDRQATEDYYADVIARASPAQVPKLLKARDEALASIKAASATGAADGQPGVAPETREFFAKHPYLATPSNADDHAMRGWAIGRAAELEAKHPNASLEQVYNQLSAELIAKREFAVPTTTRTGGRALSDNGGGGSGISVQRTGKMSPADMTAEQRSAFNTLVNLKAYKPADVQKYCDDLSRSEAELAMKGKN